MRDLDFRGVLEDVGDAAQQPEFATVKRRASRMRTRRRLLATGGALSVAAVLAAGGVAVTGVGGAALEPAGAPAVETGPERIRWAAAGDADHLYAMVACLTCDATLMASTDGGKTWQQRPAQDWFRTVPAPLGLHVLGPQIIAYTTPLSLDGSNGSGGKTSTVTRRISIDGGLTWRDLSTSQEPVTAAPAGTRLLDCALEDCGVYALDPAAGVLAPLAKQPPLTRRKLVDAPPDAGLWVSGYDPAIRKPTVAVSRNGGRDWDVHVFAEEAAVSEGGIEQGTDGSQPVITTADGQTVYATVRAGEGDLDVHLYRSTDGGETWQRTNPDGPPSGLAMMTDVGYVTADGAHVTMYTEGDTFVLRASTDGRTYRPLVADGGPPKIGVPPSVLDAGHYLLYTQRAIYLSDNGRTWHQLTLPQP